MIQYAGLSHALFLEVVKPTFSSFQPWTLTVRHFRASSSTQQKGQLHHGHISSYRSFHWYLLHPKAAPQADSCSATSNSGDPNSFAYSTARERWPRILASAIGEISTTLSQDNGLSREDVEAGKTIQSQIESLRSSILNNTSLEPIPEDGGPDIAAYNEEFETLRGRKWQASPWLYTECYMYRLIHTFFTLSTPLWQTFDMFTTSKRASLVSSKKGTIELVKRFRGVLQAEVKDAVDEATQKAIFEEMIQISLWGNATDLSLLTSLSAEELNSRQGKAVRDSAKANILVDDTEQVWSLLSNFGSSGSSGSIHIVLDNAGFELLTDLVFAGYLVESGYTKRIVLHGKRMPWFVSDVNADDLTWLIQSFKKGTIYDDIDERDKEELQAAGKYWQGLMDSGKMIFEDDPFWTTQHSFGRMPVVQPELFDGLAAADLVVYKGDLNYRKLTYDGLWPHSTPFSDALGPLAKKHNGKGIRHLALRTAKADVCVGLKPGQDKNLEEDWTRTGKYAVISYYDAKS